MGWEFFDDGGPDDGGRDMETADLFARTFGTGAGADVLDQLVAMTAGRTLPPSASDAALRHHEGARALVARIVRLTELGLRGPAARTADDVIAHSRKEDNADG